jgi:hypothetical protein
MERKANYIKVIKTGEILPYDINTIAYLYDHSEAYVIIFNDGSEKLVKFIFNDGSEKLVK